jgi:poly(A) polymerase
MPISEAFPTKEDLESSDKLLQTLKDQGLFESEEESKRRQVF